MWELDYKESWVLKNWCFWTVMLENTLESPLDCKEIKLVNPKGNQFWILIRETIGDAEAPVFWLPDAKGWLIEKDHDVWKDRRQEEKGATGWDIWMASLTRWTWVWASLGEKLLSVDVYKEKSSLQYCIWELFFPFQFLVEIMASLTQWT